MPRLQAVPPLVVAALLAPGPAIAADGRFTAPPPPLGYVGYTAGTLQYQLDVAYRSYRSGTTDLAGPSVSLQRRQAFSDRFAFSMSGTASYRAGSDRILGRNDDLRLWQTTIAITGELQHHLTPEWNAILFAGPRFGVGGYDVDPQGPSGERLDAATQLAGYLLGLQSTIRIAGLHLTPFGIYEENDLRHEVDPSKGGSRTADYRFRVVQYGIRASLVGSGLTLGATLQERSVDSSRSRYTIYNLGYRF